MSGNRMEVTVIRNACYWIGVAMAVACAVLVFAKNTELLWRFEHAAFPLSWAAGIGAILAFLAVEFCDSTSAATAETESALEIIHQEL